MCIHLGDAESIGDVARPPAVDVAERHQLYFRMVEVIGYVTVYFISSDGTDADDADAQSLFYHRHLRFSRIMQIICATSRSVHATYCT